MGSDRPESDDAIRKLSLEELDLLDAVCDAFEQEFRSGRKPEIESYLEGDGSVAVVMFRELLRIELDFHCRDDSEISLESLRTDYCERFPNHRDAIGQVLEDIHRQPEGVSTGWSTPASIPDRIGSFELIEKIGQGGMGVVFRARHTRLKRHVALKLMKESVAATESDLKRFQLEAEAAARLRHPNIVQVFEVGEEDGYQYIAMELIEGMNLSQLTDREPQLPHSAARVCRDLADAIAHAHEQGIIHRDIKPGNILVGTRLASPKSGSTIRSEGIAETIVTNRKSLEQEAGDLTSPEREDGDSLKHDDRSKGGSGMWSRIAGSSKGSRSTSGSRLENSGEREHFIKVTDFGLAKLVDSGGELTGTGAVLGTPEYMAPEQAGGHARTAGESIDVYAVGGILYYLLTGKPPFSAATPVQTVLQVVNRPVVAPSLMVPGIPRDLETICLKCLEKEPAKRIESADEVARELTRFLNGEPIRSRAVGRLERGWRWCRRHKAVSGLATACVLLFVIGFVLVTWKWRDAVSAQMSMQQQQAEFLLRRGLEICEEGRPEEGIHWIVEALQTAVPGSDHDSWRDMARRNVQAWSEQLPRVEHKILFPDQQVSTVGLSPDGRLMVVGLAEGKILRFDTATGQTLNEAVRLDIRKDGWSLVTRARFHPNGHEYICSAVEETGEEHRNAGIIQRFDRQSGQPIGQPRRFPMGVYEVTYFAGGSQLVVACGVSGSDQGFLQRVDAETLVDTGPPLQAPGQYHNLAFDRDEKILFCNVRDEHKTIKTRIYSVEEWQPIEGDNISDLLGEREIHLRLSDWFLRNSNAASDWIHLGDVMEVDANQLHVLGPRDPKDTWRIRNLSNSVTMYRNPRSPITRNRTTRVPETGNTPCRLVETGPDGSVVLIGDDTGLIQVRECEPGSFVFPPIDIANRVTCGVFHPDGHLFAAGSDRVRIWNSRTGEPESPWIYLENEVNAMAFSPDGSILATGDFAFNVQLWDVATGRSIGSVMPQRDIVMCLAFSPDGKKLAAGTAIDWHHDPQARIWDVETCQPIGPPMKHGHYVRRIQFSRDGGTVLTVSSDRMARLWDANTATLIGKPLAIAQHWGHAQMDSTGNRLLIGNDTGDIQIWDVESQKPVKGKSWKGDQVVTALRWSPDERWFVVGYNDGSSQIFDSEWVIPIGPATTKQSSPVKRIQFLESSEHWQTVHENGSVFRWIVSRPVDGSPDELRLVQEIATGIQLDENHVLIPVSGEQWLSTRQQVSIGGPWSEDVERRWQLAMLKEAESDFNFVRARDFLKRLILQEPQTVNYRLRLGRSFSMGGDYEAANREYQQAATLPGADENQSLALWYRQRVYESERWKRYQDVVWYADRLDELRGMDWRIEGRRSEALWQLQRRPESRASLEKAAGQSDDPRFLYASATKFAERYQDWQWAEKLLKKSDQYEPLSPTGRLSMALVYLKNNDIASYLEMCDAFVDELENLPLDYYPVREMTRLLMAGPSQEKHWLAALKAIEQLLQQMDSKPAQRFLLRAKGGLLVHLGRADEALADLQRSIEVTGLEGDVIDWSLLASACEQIDDLENKRRYRQKVKSWTPPESASIWNRTEKELVAEQFGAAFH